MAEVNNENANVIDAEIKEETAMATTTQPAAPEKTKFDIVVGMVKTGAKVVGAVALTAVAFCAGYTKGKKRAAAKASSNEDIVEEPTTEDEVSE